MKVCTCMVVSTDPCEAHPLPAAEPKRCVVPLSALAAIEARVGEGFAALAAAAKLQNVDPVDYSGVVRAMTLVFHALDGIHETVKVIVEENGHGS